MNDNTIQYPIRVLNLFTIMDRGGAETMVMNYYRHIDRTKVQFDFLVHREKRGAYDDEIEALGGKIYRLCPIYIRSTQLYILICRSLDISRFVKPNGRVFRCGFVMHTMRRMALT